MREFFGNVTLYSGAISLLTAKNIPVYFYNRNERYKGYLMTPHYKSDGIILIKQFEAYFGIVYVFVTSCESLVVS